MFFYQSATMGFYGEGYFWHKNYNFPKFPIITKTVTLKRKIGFPFAIIKIGDFVWNHVALHNIGFYKFLNNLNKIDNLENLIISIAGEYDELIEMITFLELLPIKGIELNFSCPNFKDFKTFYLPKSILPLYLKLRHSQDVLDFRNLENIKEIHLNSIPKYFGGVSGKYAKEKNWEFIKRWSKHFNVSGASWNSFEDLDILSKYCKTFGIGSVILTNPKLVEKLNEYTNNNNSNIKI